jgi:chromosome partitioning protein
MPYGIDDTVSIIPLIPFISRGFMIVLMGSGKGGVGKTTLAVQLARQRAAQGREVLLIETDKQQSAALWAAIRVQEQASPPVPCVSIFGDRVADQVRSLIPKYDDLIIDTRGADSPEMRSAMTVANLLLTPIRTSQFDLATVSAMDSLLEQARGFNPDLQAYIVLNGTSTNAKSKREQDVRDSLGSLKHYTGVLRTGISSRTAFEQVAEQGRAVTEFKQRDSKAIAELEALTAEVFQ